MVDYEDIIFVPGDLVQYFGPPILNPPRWNLIVANNNGIINYNEIGIVIESDKFLRIAKVYFQENEIIIERITFSRLKYVK